MRYPDSGEVPSFELSLCASSPADVLPPGIGEHVLRPPFDRISGARAAAGDGRAQQWAIIQPHIDRVRLEVTRNTDSPEQAALRHGVTERRRSCRNRHLPARSRSGHRLQSCDQARRARSPASSVRFDVRSERRPASNATRSLVQLSADWHKGVMPPSPALRLAPASATPASGSWRSCPAPKRHCGATPTDMLALLRHRRVVDHQHRISAANELISLDEKLSLQRSRVPDTSRNKMVQPIIAARRKTLGHWLNALAVTWPDQPRHIKRTHPLPRLVNSSVPGMV